MNKIRSALPEGSTKCRIRTSAREMHQPATGSLLDTLGEGDIVCLLMRCGCVASCTHPAGFDVSYQKMSFQNLPVWFFSIHRACR